MHASRISHASQAIGHSYPVTKVQIPLGSTQMVFSPDYLAEQLTPYPLPTKDAGVLRTIGDARAYMLALSKEREWRDHWKHTYRLLVHGPCCDPKRLSAASCALPHARRNGA